MYATADVASSRYHSINMYKIEISDQFSDVDDDGDEDDDNEDDDDDDETSATRTCPVTTAIAHVVHRLSGRNPTSRVGGGAGAAKIMCMQRLTWLAPDAPC